MKKLIYPLLFLPFLASCDQVDENDRYIEAGGVEVARKVLLEEFTGQKCVNCPQAHAMIERLEEQYGEDLIVVSIHAGGFGIASPNGLMQEEGDAYAKRWDIVAYPEGVVDRTGSSLSVDSWSAAIRSELGKETDIELSLKAELSEDEDIIYIHTNIFGSENVDAFLQLWVIENDITTLQYDGDQTIGNYIHNNVFRACVNGLWGQEISLKAYEGQSFDNSIAVFRDPAHKVANWNVDNLYIIGFVYTNSQGVLQVEKTKVI